MNVVFTNLTGFRNRGVEAMVVPTIEQVLQHSRNGIITILTPMPDYDSRRVQSPNVEIVANDFIVDYPKNIIRRTLRSLANVVGKRPWYDHHNANKILRSASLIIALGGDVFSSVYGGLDRHLQPLRYSQKYGIPVVFMAHSIGPFHTRHEIKKWTRVARQSSLITVRETKTYNYLRNELDLPFDLVHQTADPAFLLEPCPKETVERLLKFYGIDKDRQFVSLAISQGISRFSGVDRSEHFQAWCQVIKTLIDNHEIQVLLIPHVQNTAVTNDDRLIATKLVENFNYDPRIRMVGGDHSASEFKGLIAASDMVVAERMHAAIAGLSSGVCTVVVGYSVKAQGIMTDVLGAELVKNGLVIPVQEFVNGGTSGDNILTAWQLRGEVENILRDAVPRFRDLAARNFELLHSL